jgi:hypothetical protein
LELEREWEREWQRQREVEQERERGELPCLDLDAVVKPPGTESLTTTKLSTYPPQKPSLPSHPPRKPRLPSPSHPP